MNAFERFKQANKISPIVFGEWLDKNKHPVTGAPETWVYMRYRLENGKVFTFHKDLGEPGYHPRWMK